MLFSRARIDSDVASAMAVGQRSAQEDAIITDYTIGSGVGLVVLADGMGGHRAGAVASNLVVTEVYSELRYQFEAMAAAPDEVPGLLWSAARTANARLKEYVSLHPKTEGMGTTLIAAVQIGAALYWVSVGDSVLYLARGGKLRRLNQDHSLAPQIDYMVRQGVISEAEGRAHPDRGVLTSALNGQKIRFVDCPEAPLALRSGDVVVAASDGLTSLDKARILTELTDAPHSKSAEKARRLLSAIRKRNDPEQDNVCFAVIQMPGAQAEAPRPDLGQTAPAPKPTVAAGHAPAQAAREMPPFLARIVDFGSGLLR